jgi:hypothetical protein
MIDCENCKYYEEIYDPFGGYYNESCSHEEGIKICDEVRMQEMSCEFKEDK